MNIRTLPLSLLLCLGAASSHLDAARTPAPIQSPMLQLINGVTMIKLVSCHTCIKEVLAHNFSKNPNEVITLEHLAAQEASMSPEKVKPFLRQLITNMVNMLDQKGYLSDFDAIRKIFDELIDAWTVQNNRFDTLLRTFADQSKTAGAECDILCTKIETIRAYHTFLTDLEMFLQDLIVSCPEAYAQYQEAANSLANQRKS